MNVYIVSDIQGTVLGTYTDMDRAYAVARNYKAVTKYDAIVQVSRVQEGK